MTLNASQLQAVTTNNPYVVVIAGPGSGKTRVLVERVKHEISRGADPCGIVVITFTNGAAHELKERLGHIRLGYIGTLHGFLFRLLQKYGKMIGYKQGSVSIIPPEAAEEMKKDTALRMKIKLMGEKAAGFDSRLNQENLRMVEADYQSQLKLSNMVDYDGILRQGLRLIQCMNALGDDFGVQSLYVDEAQDASSEDWQIYDAVPGTKFIVGDLDQSIYQFRGAAPELFTTQATRPGTYLIKIEENYRSDTVICDAANRLIAHNKERIPKIILPVSKDKGFLEERDFPTGIDEARTIATMAALKTGTVAILARTNFMAQTVRDILRAGGVKTEDRTENDLPKDWGKALTAVGLLVDPNDIVVARFLRYSEWAKDVDRLRLKAQAEGKPLYAAAAIYWLMRHPDISVVPRELARLGVGEESVALVEQRIAVLPQSEPTLSDLLQDLYSHENWSGEGPRKDGIFVGTVHKSKGREFDHVYVIGCEEGLFPSLKKDSDEAEERRLFFVAITRARHTLHLSYAHQRAQQWGTPAPAEASRFLKEINP